MQWKFPFTWGIKTVGSEIAQDTQKLGAQQVPVGAGPIVGSGVYEGSVVVGPLSNYLGLNQDMIEAPLLKWSNILGTPADVGPIPFPTVRSGYAANHKYYPGLGRSYLGAATVESPMHKQIVYATSDIPSVQLTIRGGISPAVLQRWQLATTMAASQQQV